MVSANLRPLRRSYDGKIWRFNLWIGPTSGFDQKKIFPKCPWSWIATSLTVRDSQYFSN